MGNLPADVLRKFKALKAESKRYLELKVIKGRYFFVFEATSRWDKEKKKTVKVSRYLGRITPQGVFNLARHRQRVVQLPPKTEESEASQLPELEDIDAKILTALTMNGRITYPHMAELYGISPRAAESRTRKLEKLFGITYTTEINTEKFGLTKFFIKIKFLGAIPNASEMRTAFLSLLNVQLILLVTGDYDVLLYVLAKSDERLDIGVMRSLRKRLSGYRAIWTAAPIYEDRNTIPLQDSVFDLLKDYVWTKSSKEKKRADSISHNELAVLRELNRSGSMPFSEIDAKCRLGKETSQHIYHKLREKGALRRITINMTKVPVKYFVIIDNTSVDLRMNMERQSRQAAWLSTADDAKYPIDRYTLRQGTIAPDGGIGVAPIFRDSDLERIEREYAEGGGEVRISMIYSTLFGTLPLHKLDPMYNPIYSFLSSEYGYEKQKPIDYG